MVGGHHRRGVQRRRWLGFVVAGALVLGVGAATAVAAGAVPALLPAAGCRALELTVAVDPAVLDAVTAALDSAAAVDGNACVRQRVVEAAPELGAAVEAGAGPLPAIWIPDSVLAIDPFDTAPAIEVGASLASSPVVLAVPGEDADRFGDPAAPVPFGTMLSNPAPPALPDPSTDRLALATLGALRVAIGDDDGRPKQAFVAAALAFVARGPLPSPQAGFDAMDRDGAKAGAFLTSEMSVLRHNRQGGARVSALAVQGGGGALDFPFVRVAAGLAAVAGAAQTDGAAAGDGPDSAKGQVAAAASVLEARLRGPAGRVAFAAAGLRAPDGTRPTSAAVADGWLAPRVPVANQKIRDVATETLKLWKTLTAPSANLAVVDVSGSMAAPLGNIRRIDLAAGAAASGLAIFPDQAAVGTWTFSERPPPEKPWQEVVPVGLLGDPVPGFPDRRAALLAADAELSSKLGGGTGLYETVLAAVRSLQAHYRPGYGHSVSFFSDGANEIDGGIQLPELLATLRAEADPAKPVPLIMIGIGPDADMDALTKLAEVTGGRAYNVFTPEDMRPVFLDALSLRVCRPSCS